MASNKQDHYRNTIYDVADHAGVAISTVSRVLNGSADVSDPTRERVLKAIRELQFRPDRTAKSLAQRSVPTLVIAVPTFTTPFHNELLKGVRSRLQEADVDLLVCDLRWSAPEESLRHFLQRGTVDGLLLTGLDVSEKMGTELRSLGAPVVLVGRRWDGLDSFYWDEVAGAQMAVEHLIERGHERIGLLAANIASPSRDDRIKGYRLALEKHDLPADDALICYGRTEKHAGFSEEAGYEAMQEILALDPPVTACFASSDVQAIGAWKAVRETGRRVPEDIALIGYDDIKTSYYIDLTTIAQNMHDVGEEAAALLMSRVTGGGTPEEPATTLVEPKLMVRQST